MKKILASILYCLFILVLSNKSHAQNCGINPGILLIEDWPKPYYQADTSSLQPGWSIYQMEWVINNNIAGANDSVAPFLKFGYNHISLKVYATNISTGDSCIGEHSNIFFSTGNAVFAYADVIVNGLTVDIVINYQNNGVPYSAEDFMFNFGDGTEVWPNDPFISYTYAAPGIYTIACGIYTNSIPYGNAGATFQQEIEVGVSANFQVYHKPETMYCDTVRAAVDGNGVMWATMYSHLIDGNQGGLSGTAYNNFELKNIPGQDYLRTLVGDGQISAWTHNMFVVQDCGIIPDTAYGKVFNDINANGIQDPMEQGIAGHSVYARSTFNYLIPVATSPVQRATYNVLSDASGNFKIPLPHDDIALGCAVNAGQVGTTPIGYTTAYDTLQVNYGPYNFGISYLNAEICGTAYLDDNQDSVYTQSVDRPLKHVLISCRNTSNGMVFYASTNSNGDYCADVTQGNYDVSPVYYLLDSADAIPDSVIVNLAGGGSTQNVDFGFTSPIQTNFGVDMSPGYSPKPGFSHTKYVRVQNTGILNSQGTLVMNYSPVYSSVLQYTAGGTVNTTNKTITWLTDSIGPGQIQSFSAEFAVPASTPLGTVVTNYSNITAIPGFTDLTLTNNSDTISQIVVGAFDPNDKVSTPAGISPGGIVMPDTRLTYKIRFQNTGTASATNVYVTDTLDINLDMNTMQMLNSSHPYTVIFNGRVIIWQFENINLPDSGANYELSNGFVEFAISPVAGLSQGTVIGNDANIYFDFNEPITTNEIINTFQTTFSGISEQAYYGNVELFPQPASDRCELVLHEFPSGKCKISLMDLSGRIISEFEEDIRSNKFKINLDLQSLSKGFYLINVTAGQTRITKQLIKL